MSKIEEDIINIKLVNDELFQKVNFESSTNQHSKILNTIDDKLKNEKEFIINKNSTISILKIYISEIKNISCEKIHLFIKYPKNKKSENDNNENSNIYLKNITINEYLQNKKYMEELLDDTDTIEKYLDIADYTNNINNSPTFYYIISNNNINSNASYYSISIIIDFYQKNIDKIFLNIQSNCSLFLLKNIVNNKLNNILNINQLKLICIDITKINNEQNKRDIVKNNNNIFSDRKTLDEIITYFFPIQNNIINCKYTIHFLLIIKNDIGSSEQIGLNFRFNYLKDVNKISFNKNAPKYCECSDGINLFAFCFNQECFLYNKYFVVHLGYGLFNILKISKRIKCPKCGENNNIEIKNIGIINSKYFYSGKLKVKDEKQKSSFEGDGITLDDKLYIFKEAKIDSFLIQLYIEAKPHFIIMNKIFASKRTKEDEELDDIALCDCDYIKNNNIGNKNNNNAMPSLFTSSTLGIDYKYISGFSSKTPQQFLKTINSSHLNNLNKVKIYENESEISVKNDIIVDKFDDKSLNEINSINCIGDDDIFSGGCFTTKKENESTNNENIQKSSFCFIF